MTDPLPDDAPSTGDRIHRGLRGFVLHAVVPAIVLFAAWRGASYLLSTAPETTRKPKPRSARPVETVRVEKTRETPRLEAMGVVRAAREVTVRVRVAGEVISVAPNFEPGGRFHEGEDMLCVDRTDYDLAVLRAAAEREQASTELARAKAAQAQRQSDVLRQQAALAEAEARLQLEEGNQEIARREYEMLESGRGKANPELALRGPQLAIARASVEAARATVTAAQSEVVAAAAAIAAAAANLEAAEVRVQGAEIDRERTTLKAPFNAWIRERKVEVGAIVSAQTDVATLVGSDAYWVEISLPISDLQRVRLTPEGETGATVDIYDEAAWGPGVLRKGQLLRVLGDIEAEGRMARLLVKVQDPLHLEAPAEDRHALLTGSYVRVAIDGRAIDDVVAIDRAWLRHGDVVWVADAKDQLQIQDVEIAWRGRTRILVSSGLQDGDRVITTDLAAPVADMPLRVTERATETARR